MEKDILEYKGNFTFQDQAWNKTSVDKFRKLRQVALVAFKSQKKKTEMPSKDTGEIVFKEWPAKMHHEPILWEVCSSYDTSCTIFKIGHPDHGNRVHDFKWKWWLDTEDKRKKDTKGKASAKHEADAQESPAKKTKKATTKKNKKNSLRTNRKGKKTNYPRSTRERRVRKENS